MKLALLALLPCHGTPAPSGKNVITLAHVRITVLTASLLRIEQRGGRGYDDRPSLAFPFRGAAPAVDFTVTRPSTLRLVLKTSKLTLHLDEASSSGGLTPASLFIEFSPAAGQPKRTWRFGDADLDNLNGTRHSLDCYTAVETCLAPGLMEAGLLSRLGAVLWEDTHRARFEDDNATTAWVSRVPAMSWAGAGYRDFYFFGHGRDYRAALSDYTLIGGKPELPPTVALGVWWSRYNNYTEAEFVEQVLQGYADHALPLSVAVMDVDWHTRVSHRVAPSPLACALACLDRGCIPAANPSVRHRHPPSQPGHNSPAVPGCDDYGGFVWNRDLFTDPVAWVDRLHSASGTPTGHPLMLLLNLHLLQGVDRCQPSYAAIAAAVGMPTPAIENGTVVACDIMDRRFTDALFEHALGHQPGMPTATLAGADAWWTDYSGCPKVCLAPGCRDETRCATLDQSNCSSSMLWSNLIFARQRQLAGRRPLVLSRWGGLGGHRAPLGFSGDTHACWQTLRYQIGFTATAANVLQTWSHDLGGFYAFDDGDPTNVTGSELLLRWLQFGAVSPVFRTHCSGVHDGPHCLRRIWLFPHYAQMRDALMLRDALLPYLATAYRAFHDTGVAVVHPCYYEHPEEAEAYTTADTQYRFGAQVLAAPITRAASDPLNGSISQSVWLPPGEWVDWHGVRRLVGPVRYARNYSHAEIPLFVRAGAAIPTKGGAPSSSAPLLGDLRWIVFVGGASVGSGLVYDDEGEGLGYKAEEYATTRLHYNASWVTRGHVEITLTPDHRCAGSGCARWATRAQRRHAFELRGLTALGLSIGAVACDGVALPLPRASAGSIVSLPQRQSLTDTLSVNIKLV